MARVTKPSVRITALAITAQLLLGTGAAPATEITDLYQAQTIVTGQRDETRIAGFATCLEDVLVKVSGDPRLIGDSRVDAMAADAAAYVTEFRYRDRMAGLPVHDEQGTRDRPYDLTVSFDPAKIDAALRSLGRETWGASRPRVIVLLGIDNGATTYVLAGDGERGLNQREALAAAAARRGVPIALPSEEALATAGLRFENLWAADPSRLDTVAAAIGSDVALVGRLVWNEKATGWVADWRLRSADQTYQWQIRGVSFDEAFRRAMGGTAQILSGHGQPD
jgi:hypothetical protein